MMEIEVINGYGSDEIEKFVASHSCSLFYATQSYVEIISKETESSAHWIVVSDQNRILAVLPLMVKAGIYGPVVNSLAYYGSNGGIIASDDNAKLSALNEFIRFCNRIEACSSTLISNPLMCDSEWYEKNFPYDLRDERIGQFTYFPRDKSEASLMTLFDDPRPRNIRKAQRSGICVESTQSEDAIRFLHLTHSDNIRSIGGIPKSKMFFDRILDQMPRNSWNIYIAIHNNKKIAALLLFYFNNTVEYFTPCIIDEYRSLQALSLIIYRSMVDAMNLGYVRWNWGGTWLKQDGVYAFKKKWSTTDDRYFYFTRLHSKELLQKTSDGLLREYPGFYVVPFSALNPLR